MTDWRDAKEGVNGGVYVRPEKAVRVKKVTAPKVSAGRSVNRLVDGDGDDRPVKRKLPLRSKCPALECLLCQRRYSPDEIFTGLYRLETMICSRCYLGLQSKSGDRDCFGRPPIILESGKTLMGYDPKARECQGLCADREVCRTIVAPDYEPDPE